MWKIVLVIVAGCIVSLGLLVGTGVISQDIGAFFGKRQQNIQRDIFEGSQSYSQGKSAEISKYYLEFQSANTAGKDAITQVIKLTFSDFDANKIHNQSLKNFLITSRGY